MKHKKGWQEFKVAVAKQITLPDDGSGLLQRTIPTSRPVSGRSVTVPGYEDFSFFIHKPSSTSEYFFLGLSEAVTGVNLTQSRERISYANLIEQARQKILDHEEKSGAGSLKQLLEAKPDISKQPRNLDTDAVIVRFVLNQEAEAKEA